MKEENKKENEDLLDLCKLNLMEDNIEKSLHMDKDATLKVIDYKKRNLMVKIIREQGGLKS